MFETTSLCDESLVLIRFTEGGLEKCLLRRGEGVNYTVDSIIVVAENNLNPSKRKDMEKIVAIIANQMILHLVRNPFEFLRSRITIKKPRYYSIVTNDKLSKLKFKPLILADRCATR